MKYSPSLSPTLGAETEYRCWRCSSPSLASCSTSDTTSESGWSFRHRRVKQILGAGVATVHHGANCANQSLVFDSGHALSSLFCSLQVSLHVLCHLRPRAEALGSMEKSRVGAKIVAWHSRSHHTAHNTHSVLNVVLREHILGGAGLISRTVSVVRGGAKDRAQLSRQSTARLQLIQVFKLIETYILRCKAVLFHDYR